MAFREVSVIEIREVLRLWLRGEGLRSIARLTLVDRKTVRRYVEAAVAAGLFQGGGEGQLTDGLLGAVVEAVRPDRPRGRGQAWERCDAERDRIKGWLEGDLTVVKIHDLLGRRGVVVPHRTLHRFCVEELGYRRARTTVRVADGEPGGEVQIDFGRMGLIDDPAGGGRRVVHALIFTAVFSRHMFVWLTHAQTTQAVIDGCEAAWRFFDGVFRVVVPDNMSAIVVQADAVTPRFTDAFVDTRSPAGS